MIMTLGVKRWVHFIFILLIVFNGVKKKYFQKIYEELNQYLLEGRYKEAR